MNSFYIFLCSDALKKDALNAYNDFRVELTNSVDFSNTEWEVGLIDLSLKSDIDKESLILCTNLITPSFVCAGIDAVLRFLPKTSGETYSYVQFDHVIYHDVLVRN